MVAVALFVGAAALLFVLDRALVAALDEAAVARTHDIMVQLRTDTTAALDAPLFDTDTRIAVVQVLDRSGRVMRSSDATSQAPLIALPPDVADLSARGIRVTDRGEADLRVSATGVQTGTDDASAVVVATSEESVESTLVTVAALLALGAPMVVVITAVVTYRLVRRSLRSVEDIRARVATISGADLDQRVPVPTTEDEIAALATTMNDMLTRVQSGHEAQRRFVADASHELRSPLATVTAALDLVLTRPQLSSELLPSTVVPEVERMRSLVDDLLLLARADEHGLPLRVGDVDFDDLVVDQVHRTTVPETITISVTAPPARLRGDAERLRRMIRNLLDNAVRHTESTVQVQVWSDPATVSLTVTDDGPGIDEADRHRVFERFVRLDQARGRSSGGSGLGLPIVAEIVAAHRGTVTITTAPGGGSRILVALPRTAPLSLPQSDRDSGATSGRARS